MREQQIASQKEMPAPNPSARDLAIKHWNKTPLFLTEEERYSTYPWLRQAAEFEDHKDERVLEIGCGTGSDLLQFAKHGAKAVGIDVTPEHIRLANQRVGNAARLLRASATQLPFSDNSFDYVYSHGVLHHIDHPRPAIEEIFRVLRPQGRFNIQVYALWSWAHLAYRLRYGRRWKDFIENSREPVHIDLYSTRTMRQLLAPAQVTFRKYELHRAPNLAGIFGWFLVATGCVEK